MGIYDDTYIYLGDEENFGFFYWLLASHFIFGLFQLNSCFHDSTKFIHSEKATKFKKSPKFNDALLARGSKGNGNYWPKSE